MLSNVSAESTQSQQLYTTSSKIPGESVFDKSEVQDGIPKVVEENKNQEHNTSSNWKISESPKKRGFIYFVCDKQPVEKSDAVAIFLGEIEHHELANVVDNKERHHLLFRNKQHRLDALAYLKAALSSKDPIVQSQISYYKDAYEYIKILRQKYNYKSDSELINSAVSKGVPKKDIEKRLATANTYQLVIEELQSESFYTGKDLPTNHKVYFSGFHSVVLAIV